MTGGRERLSNRRLSCNRVMSCGPYEFDFGFGFHRTGAVREVFINNRKVGSELEGMLQDGCVLISLLLQHHVAPAELARSVGRHGTDPDKPEQTVPTSILGVVVDAVVQVQAEDGEAIRKLYLAQQKQKSKPREDA